MLQTSAVAVASLTMLDAGATAATRYPTTGYLRSRFTPHLGTAVDLRTGKGWGVRTTLVGVEDVPHIRGLAGVQDAYLLRFRGPKSPQLPKPSSTSSARASAASCCSSAAGERPRAPRTTSRRSTGGFRASSTRSRQLAVMAGPTLPARSADRACDFRTRWADL